MDKFKAILIDNLSFDPQVSRVMFEIIMSSNYGSWRYFVFWNAESTIEVLFGAQQLIFGFIYDIVKYFSLVD